MDFATKKQKLLDTGKGVPAQLQFWLRPGYRSSQFAAQLFELIAGSIPQ
jgi:hypothetical protein